MQVARLQIQLQQVIHIRFRTAEFKNSLELINIPESIDLVAYPLRRIWAPPIPKSPSSYSLKR